MLGLLILLRLVWRLTHKAPPWAASMPHWQQQAARIGHRLLYLCMLLMPVSGYVASNFSKHGGQVLRAIALKPWGRNCPPSTASSTACT